MDLSRIEKSLENFEKYSSTSDYTNQASDYLPIGPKPIKDQELNWELVYKSIFELLLGLRANNESLSDVFDEITKNLSNNRKTKQLSNLVEEVYLQEASFHSVSPYSYLINEDKAKARTESMNSVFRGMMSELKPLDINFDGNNIIEYEINSCMKALCSEYNSEKKNYPYLPFLAKRFCKDISTMAQHADWLLREFRDLVELYSFLYLNQLSYHVSVPNLRFNEPSAQEIYFILETERASKERYDCNAHGYKRIFSDNGFSYNLFPHLGYLNLLSELPMWKIKDNHDNDAFLSKVNTLNESICDLFKINFEGHQENIESAINNGLTYHSQLFSKHSTASSRAGANEKVVNVFRDSFCLNFKSNRKAGGGWYFQLNTKTVLMVTNLILGEEKRMLIGEVINGFNEIGIFFDLKTRTALLKLYENIGNIEKLSDSGDAVYVIRTI